MNPLTPPASTALIAFALNVLLAVTVICVLALTAVRLFFRHHPAVRYYLCLIALFAILLSPLFVSLQNWWGFSLLTLPLPESMVPGIDSTAVMGEPVPIPAGARESIITGESPRFDWSAATVIAFGVWTLGVAWGGVRLVQGWRMVSRLTAGRTPWTAPDDTERTRLETALRGSLPPIYTAPKVDSPVAVGWLRPMILLPDGWAEGLAPVQLRQILLHECAHVAYRHLLGGFVERVVRLLFWFHPLVHLLCREIACAREEVCDNVASQESGAACYARTLLALAQGTLPAPSLASTLALLGPETSLEHRIAGLLNPRRNRMIPGKQGTRWALLYAIGLVLSLTLLVRVASSNQKAALGTADSLGPDAFFVRQHEQAKARAEKVRYAITAGRISVEAPVEVAIAKDKGTVEVKATNRLAGPVVVMDGAKKFAVVSGHTIEVRPAEEVGVVDVALADPSQEAGTSIAVLKIHGQKAGMGVEEVPIRGQLTALSAEQEDLRAKEEMLHKRLKEKEVRLKAGVDDMAKREAELRARIAEQEARLKDQEMKLRLLEKERAELLRRREIERSRIDRETVSRHRDREAEERKRIMELEAAAKAREAAASKAP